MYIPPCFDKREFAIRSNGIMLRHLSFPNIQKLRAFLIERAPEHVYFSSAKYEHPDIKDMQTKKQYFIGADLVFDIDYDHLKKPTLREAKKQSEKLLVILEDQLGFKKVLYVDSGSRGFHVHVHDECVQKLDNAERREIADFFGHYKTRRSRKVINPNWVEIDTVVTTDFTRLIRLPGSLNVKECVARPCMIIRNYG